MPLHCPILLFFVEREQPRWRLAHKTSGLNGRQVNFEDCCQVDFRNRLDGHLRDRLDCHLQAAGLVGGHGRLGCCRSTKTRTRECKGTDKDVLALCVVTATLAASDRLKQENVRVRGAWFGDDSGANERVSATYPRFPQRSRNETLP